MLIQPQQALTTVELLSGTANAADADAKWTQAGGDLHNTAAEIAAPLIVSGTNSSKQVSFADKKRRSNKKENSRPKMMNLDPSTHFANELDEFERPEG